MAYYKVTSTKLSSAIVTSNLFKTQYIKDEFVSSPCEGTPLCVFKTYYEARSFARRTCVRYVIWECEIKNRYKTPWIPFGKYSTPTEMYNEITTLLKRKGKILDKVWTDVPTGTVCAKYVKITKKV